MSAAAALELLTEDGLCIPGGQADSGWVGERGLQSAAPFAPRSVCWGGAGQAWRDRNSPLSHRSLLGAGSPGRFLILIILIFIMDCGVISCTEKQNKGSLIQKDLALFEINVYILQTYVFQHNILNLLHAFQIPPSAPERRVHENIICSPL